MVKHRVKVPKGYKCANGEVCQQDLELEFDSPETKLTIEKLPELEVSTPQVPAPQPQYQPPPQYTPPPAPPIPEPPQDKTLTTEELQDLMPTGVNYAECKGDNCADFVMKNKKFVSKFKSCPKCGCNNVPINSNLCPCCGKKGNEDDEDYWEESDIELKTDEEDDEDD